LSIVATQPFGCSTVINVYLLIHHYLYVCVNKTVCYMLLLVDCIKGDETQTRTTNGNVQMRPKAFPGYVMQELCWFALLILAVIQLNMCHISWSTIAGH